MPSRDDKTSTHDARFSRASRITHARDYQRVYEENVHAADDMLVVVATWNEVEVPRLGLSVSRKVGNAVQRNRWKRWIREAFRLHRCELPAGIDYVFRPRKGAVPSFESIENSVPQLARRVHRRLSQSRKNVDS